LEDREVEIMDFSENAAKSAHGYSAKNNIKSILEFCKAHSYIKDFKKNYYADRQGYTSKQFKAPYMIEFLGGEKWILFSTTSMRTDRIKGNQWDSFNLKEIDKTISKCYLVYPDSVSDKDKKEFVRQNEKYINNVEFSLIDGIVNQDELYNLIETNATKDKEVGQQKDLQGRKYEHRVASILNNTENFQKWKSCDDLKVGLNYSLFLEIVTIFNLDREKTTKIEATSDGKIIGLLPSRGKPKTDVLVTVTDNSGIKTHYTISCKKTSNDSVGVHQFKYEDFSSVLDPDNENLKVLLQGFQANPSKSSFGDENVIKLTEELKPYLRKLGLWVLGGIGGAGNKQTQWARYILTYNNTTKSAHIHTVEEYYDRLVSSKVSGTFGTIFQWTYQHKQRGKCIKLKVKIID